MEQVVKDHLIDSQGHRFTPKVTLESASALVKCRSSKTSSHKKCAILKPKPKSAKKPRHMPSKKRITSMTANVRPDAIKRKRDCTSCKVFAFHSAATISGNMVTGCKSRPQPVHEAATNCCPTLLRLRDNSKASPHAAKAADQIHVL